ncbi:hypothetical protein V8C26DRAFT_167351 [Trichoderma gracile]
MSLSIASISLLLFSPKARLDVSPASRISPSASPIRLQLFLCCYLTVPRYVPYYLPTVLSAYAFHVGTVGVDEIWQIQTTISMAVSSSLAALIERRYSYLLSEPLRITKRAGTDLIMMSHEVIRIPFGTRSRPARYRSEHAVSTRTSHSI